MPGTDPLDVLLVDETREESGPGARRYLREPPSVVQPLEDASDQSTHVVLGGGQWQEALGQALSKRSQQAAVAQDAALGQGMDQAAAAERIAHGRFDSLSQLGLAAEHLDELVDVLGRLA